MVLQVASGTPRSWLFAAGRPRVSLCWALSMFALDVGCGSSTASRDDGAASGGSTSSGGSDGRTGGAGAGAFGGTGTGGGSNGGASGDSATGGTTSMAGTTGQGGTVTGGGAAGMANGGGGTGGQVGETVTFKNGTFWNDTTGTKIQAHGGGFLKEGDTYYWVGEDKTTVTGGTGVFYAVSLYSSTNLGTWVHRNKIITPNTDPQLGVSNLSLIHI